MTAQNQLACARCGALLLNCDHHIWLPLAETPAFAAGRQSRDAEMFSANDLAILYRLIDRYTEDAYKDLPRDDPSHTVRRALREKVTKHLIAAREQERAARRTAGGRASGE